MDLKTIYSDNKLHISFEVFPEQDTENLYKSLDVLKQYNPSLVSLTFGAGGNNKAFSVDILRYLKFNMNFTLMPHFTCICNSKQTVKDNLKVIEELRIKNILALRGDIPQDKSQCVYDFRYANELVEFIKSTSNLSVAVAGYPEGHIESPDLKTDIENLKRKVDSGADVIFTQLFFDNTKFFSYVERVRKAGITIPVIPGIMPIISKKQVDKMTNLAKIEVPEVIINNLENNDNLRDFGVEYASKQCEDLIKNGVKGLHFYTLNKSYSTSKILDNIKESI